MKGIIFATYALVCCAVSGAWAQDCKPNVSTRDKITKAQVTEWAQGLYQTGLIASTLTGSAEINISGSFLRDGSANAVNLILSKQETNVARAVLESQYKADKGNEFSFGFKNGGAPLKFVADAVTSNTSADMFGNLNFRVVLTAHVTFEQIVSIQDALATRQIDAVRVSLSNLTIEKNVKETNSQQFRAKFYCFATFVDKEGGGAGSGNSSSPRGSISGKYLRKGKDGDYIQFDSGGKFSLRQDGKDYTGDYNVLVNSVIVRVVNSRAETLRMVGNALVEPDGTIWEKQNSEVKADAAKQGSETKESVTKAAPEAKIDASKQLTVDQIIKMVEAKFADDLIISNIQKFGLKFDATPDVQIKLKTSGVSDAVMRVIVAMPQ